MMTLKSQCDKSEGTCILMIRAKPNVCDTIKFGWYLINYCFNADNNECDSNEGLGPCSQICINTPGSFYCSCEVGYTLSGYACIGEKYIHSSSILHSLSSYL